MKISKTATKEEIKKAIKLAKKEIREWEKFLEDAKKLLKQNHPLRSGV